MSHLDYAAGRRTRERHDKAALSQSRESLQESVRLFRMQLDDLIGDFNHPDNELVEISNQELANFKQLVETGLKRIEKEAGL